MVASDPPEPSGSSASSEPLPSRLSRNIAARRKGLGLTQAQLAERLGIDTETLSRFERGKHLPSLVTLEKLAVLLVTTVGELLAEEPPLLGDDAIAATSWLADLEHEDRAFALEVLKQCCAYLTSRKKVTQGR